MITMGWKSWAACAALSLPAPCIEAQVDSTAVPSGELVESGKTEGAPAEILNIPKLLASIPDLALEFKTAFIAGPQMHRTHRFMKKGVCWRDESYENGKLTNLQTFDGADYYRCQPYSNYYYVTDNPHGDLSNDLMINSVFRENPLYAWASILYPVSSKNDFRPPAFSSVGTWMDELRKHTIELVEQSPKLKRYRLTDAKIQREMVFELNEEGVWLPARYQQKILAGGPGYDHTYVAEISNWQNAQVGDSTVRLPMRIATKVILTTGAQRPFEIFEIVPGSIRAVPDTVGINDFRVPFGNVTHPIIDSKNWPAGNLINRSFGKARNGR